MYPINFTIGDWSDDGHGRQKQFKVISSEPVEVVREAYWLAEKKTKFKLGSVCSNSYDNALKSSEFEGLRSLGFPFTSEEIHEHTENEFVDIDPARMLDILLWFLKQGNEQLFFDIVPADAIPSFHFSGYDKKKRHIPQFGYGLFD